VTSIDVDADVVSNARAALARAGYAQVHVVQTDAESGYATGGPYDAIIVTVGGQRHPTGLEPQVQPNTPNSRRSDCRPRLLGGQMRKAESSNVPPCRTASVALAQRNPEVG
jgi:hypothetical protein